VASNKRMEPTRSGARKRAAHSSALDAGIRLPLAVCPLCQRERKICDSHIIPEFLFVPTYDDGRALEIGEHGTRNRFVQKGRTEKLLCEKCERHLNESFEKYFCSLWYSPGVLPERPDSESIELVDLDYGRFKLFHLSILWRASVAKTKPFEQVALGPYEPRIRRMLVDREPGDEWTHQVFGTALTIAPEYKINHAMVMPPIPFRAEGVLAYVAVYGGCAWEIVVARKAVRGKLEERMLREDGSLKLGVGDMASFGPLRKHYKIFGETARKRGWKLPWSGV